MSDEQKRAKGDDAKANAELEEAREHADPGRGDKSASGGDRTSSKKDAETHNPGN